MQNQSTYQFIYETRVRCVRRVTIIVHVCFSVVYLSSFTRKTYGKTRKDLLSSLYIDIKRIYFFFQSVTLEHMVTCVMKRVANVEIRQIVIILMERACLGAVLDMMGPCVKHVWEHNRF